MNDGFVFTADTRAEEGHVKVATNKYMRPASSLLIRKGSSYGCHSVSTADGQPSILVLRVVRGWSYQDAVEEPRTVYKGRSFWL